MHSRLSLPLAGFLSCSFTTWKAAEVEKGSTLAVFRSRCFLIGRPNFRTAMQAVERARLHGAAQIIGIDINKSKREKREAFGMTRDIKTKVAGDKSISEIVKELTNGLGVDYSFECMVVPDLVNEALETTEVVTVL